MPGSTRSPSRLLLMSSSLPETSQSAQFRRQRDVVADNLGANFIEGIENPHVGPEIHIARLRFDPLDVHVAEGLVEPDAAIGIGADRSGTEDIDLEIIDHIEKRIILADGAVFGDQLDPVGGNLGKTMVQAIDDGAVGQKVDAPLLRV